MGEQISFEESKRKLYELIKDVRTAMLCTVDDSGKIRARPMATQDVEVGEDLWFFTPRSSEKLNEVEAEREVCVVYSEPKDQIYVSVSGRAVQVEDRAKAEELWNPILKAWFPKGLEDPELTLLRVRVTQAEYWDVPSGMIVNLVGFAKAVVQGETYEPGEHEKVDLEMGR